MFTAKARVFQGLTGLALLLAGGLVGRFAFSVAAGASETTPAPGATNAKVKALLVERLATAREIAAQIATAYKGGQLSSAAVREANLMVLNAELDLCESDKERVAVHEKIVAEHRQHEEMLGQTGLAISRSTLLKAKVSRLEAEIALERARTKAGEKK